MVIKINKKMVAVLLAVVLIASVILPSADVVLANSELKTDKLPVVMYHQLTRNHSKASKYVLTVEQFEKDLIYLKQKGYKTVTVQQLVDYSNGKCDLPEKSVMITFDDGCETVYEYALPLLEKYGFSAVCFIIGAVTDKYSEINDHNLTYSNLDWNAVKALSNGGVIEIQSHTYNLHDNTKVRSGLKKTKNESFEQYSEFLTADTVKMKEKMLENIGKEPVAIAYPFGSYSKETADILKLNGIKVAFTCEERVNIIKKSESEWLFRLGRFNRPSGVSSESFFGKWE